VQQIVFDTFHAGAHFGLLFGASAATMAVTSYLNSRIVMAFGTRRILLGGLTAFVLLTGLHFVLNEISGETLWRFMILQACSLACYGLITGNLTSIAMHPLGHIAGTASAVQGTITTFGGALIGFAIGQAFDGTPQPLVGASFLLGTIALLLALWANRIPHEVQMEKGAV
jgi:DHA1 family bicyclomycin/chloramphenicol resistance-like MFS transporter